MRSSNSIFIIVVVVLEKCRFTSLERLLSYGGKFAQRYLSRFRFFPRIGSSSCLDLFFSIYMAWRLREFIICIALDQRFKIPVFFFLPELGPDRAYISETFFSVIFCSFVLWTLNPFFFQSKRIYTVLIWCRVLAYLSVCQILRIITFYSTQLPGPNYHCREGSKLARLPPPKTLFEAIIIKFPRGALFGCGDLIFSSHMIFTLVFVCTYQKNGTKRWIKHFAWLLAVIQSLLIIASRKHYTVDVVVAWYTVNLVVMFVDNKLPELPERSVGSTTPPLLPLSTREGEQEQRRAS